MSTKLDDDKLKVIVEAAVFASSKPLSIDKLQQTVLSDFKISKKRLKTTLSELTNDYQARGVRLVEVASGYRFQADSTLAPYLGQMWTERPTKYSRALLETLALIAYKQPITRGEIENVRGVSVSSNIMRTLVDRNWIKVVGHKEVPGRPSLYATTNEFLDYFGLSNLAQLPELIEPESLDLIAKRLENEFMGTELTPERPSQVNVAVNENK